MKNITLVGGLALAALVAGGCSSTGTANKTANTSTTTTTTTSNTANKPAPPATNTANTSTTNTTSSSTTAPAEGKQDFTVHNATGVEIDQLHVSPHDVDDWQEDILGRDTLANGESVSITFQPKEKAAMWDLKITDKQGTSIEWENLNLMEISEVTLHFDNGKPTATVK